MKIQIAIAGGDIKSTVVLNHPAVIKLTHGTTVITEQRRDGIMYSAGRTAVWVPNPMNNVWHVTLIDGKKEAYGEGKTLVAALDSAAKARFVSVRK